MVSNSLKLEEIDEICGKIEEIIQKIGVEMPYTYFLKLSTVYFSKGEFEKSLKMLNLAEDLAKKSDAPEIWLNKVEIFKSLGKNFDAIKYHKKYFEICPNDTKVISEFADFSEVLLKHAKMYKVNVLEVLVSVGQKVGVKMPYTPFLKRATEYFSMGYFINSLKMLNLAENLAEKSDAPEIWLNKVENFKSLAKNTDAIKYYKKYFEIYPNDTKVINEFIDFSKAPLKLSDRYEAANVLENLGSTMTKSIAMKLRDEADKRKRAFLSDYLPPIRILHVDDEPGDLEITGIFLQRETKNKFEIVGVQSAKAALKKLEKERFDVIVTDYRAPQMDGLELLEALKKSKKYARLPVIMFSGKGMPETYRSALELGAERYISKGGATAVKQIQELWLAIVDVVV